MSFYDHAPLMRQQPIRPTVIPYFPIPSVQVAGTNGKGSTCAFLSAILQAHGKRVGLYTSPHLLDITERIQINGQAVDKSVLYFGLDRVEKRQAGLCQSDLLFFTACDYFVENHVDIGIFETGMGGRLDSVSLLYHRFGILTHVDLDHVRILGDTLRQITLEKCGIIKPGMKLVVQKNQEMDLIRKICTMKQGQIWDLFCALCSVDDEGWSFSFDGLTGEKIVLSMEGKHQGMNALSALVCARNILGASFSLKKSLTALRGVRLLGRLSKLAPGIYCDVSHNPDGIETLCQWILPKAGSKVAVVSIPKTKDANTMLSRLVQSFDQVIYTQADEKSTWPIEGFASVTFCRDTKEAIKRARAIQPDWLIFCGSFAMVRYVNQHLESIV